MPKGSFFSANNNSELKIDLTEIFSQHFLNTHIITTSSNTYLCMFEGMVEKKRRDYFMRVLQKVANLNNLPTHTHGLRLEWNNLEEHTKDFNSNVENVFR